MPDPLASLGHFAATADAALAHAAGWLLAKLDSAKADLAKVEASSPFVVEAITAAEAYATAHGVPLASLADVADSLLALATKVAAPAAPPAPQAAA